MILSNRMAKTIVIFLLCFIAFAGGTSIAGGQGSHPFMQRLLGHVPEGALRDAHWLGRESSDASITMALALPLRNQTELADLIRRIYDPADPLYGKYLTTQDFINQFSPTQDDYDLVANYARSIGLTVARVHSNRLLLEVSGTAQAVENAFGLKMHRFQTKNGRAFHAPDNNPEVPDYIAARIVGVVGLDNAAVWHVNHYAALANEMSQTPLQIGSGPGGAMTPKNISTAYNLDSFQSKGSGQFLGLFELDGYNASDISAYANYFGLTAVPLKNVLVGGYSGKAGSGASEVTLDIELMMAVAPKASQILVYEGPNTSSGVLGVYNQMATDNIAKQISTSWGLSESLSNSALLAGENAIFAQMAAQGQTIYAAAGDSGAYDNGSTLTVDDPASQPFVVGVGGTRLYVNSDGTYNHETTWNHGSASAGAGGGGISAVWGIPSYQQGVATIASAAMRNVPDVALDSDPSTGYSIYYNGKWYVFGGTSCAAPLWAGFTAIANQKRAEIGSSTLGFANPLIYQIGKGAGFSLDFFDITDGSTNLYYAAKAGYDNATGWGSFNGANLIAALTSMSPTVLPPSAPQNLKATAGNASVTLSWTAASLATKYTIYRGTSSGAGSLSLIATATTNSYTDASLANGTTYYYAVKAANSAGISDFSAVISAQPALPALAITAGPYLSLSANRTSATISWTTNAAANSTIVYGTSATNLNQTASSSASSVSHALALSPLTRGATYYLQIKSSNASGSVASPIYYFTNR